jgi:hypothetical protein
MAEIRKKRVLLTYENCVLLKESTKFFDRQLDKAKIDPSYQQKYERFFSEFR